VDFTDFNLVRYLLEEENNDDFKMVWDEHAVNEALGLPVVISSSTEVHQNSSSNNNNDVNQEEEEEERRGSNEVRGASDAIEITKVISPTMPRTEEDTTVLLAKPWMEEW
jgi:hypothetical protein